MPRTKSGKDVKSINFDKLVLEQLEERCRKEKILVSTFVNDVIKGIVMSEYQFHNERARQLAIELSKEQTLRDTSPDRPKGEKNGISKN